ncbi:hypothetical protein C8Q79DRAFT_923304 [Trametes meyenii]|nr:hypothetical protein C8Q79DRAFT_923304 [Trametes meyenii]
MFAAAILLLAAVSPAFGTVFMTSPVGSTSWAAGQQVTISWKDDGQSPSLPEFGPSKVSVYVGSQTQQTLIQEIVPSVDVSTTSSIVFTPDGSKGENGAYYFIRIESLALKDKANPQFPAEAFSAKYTMTGMTGTFDATVKAQIGAAAGSSASSAPSGTTAAGSSAAASKTASTSSHAASASTSAKANNGAISVSNSAVACFAGVAAVALSMLF